MSDIRLQCVNGSGTPVFLVNNTGIITSSSAQITNANITTQTAATSTITTSLIAIGNTNTVGNIFTTGGNIGIGTTAPSSSARLDVKAASETSGALVAAFGGSSNLRILLYDANSSLQPEIVFNHSFPATIEALGNIIFLPTGNVGINTYTPQYRLDVNGRMSVRNGNGADEFTKNQIVFGFGNTNNYSHAIKTRHQDGLNNANNAIDFYGWQTSDAASAVGSEHMMSITSVGVGMGTQYPSGTIHAKNTSGHALVAIDSTAGNYGLLEFYNMDYRIATIYRPPNGNDLRFYIDAAGTDVLTFATNGNIGIRDNNPLATLDIYGSSSTFGQLWLGNAVQNRKLVLYSSATNEHQFFGFGINNGTLRYQVSTTSDAHIFYVGTSSTTSNELMRIQGNGNVGIGINNPIYKLQVDGDIAIPYGNAIRVTNVTNTKLMETQHASPFDQTRIYAPGTTSGSDTPKITIQNNGLIGINTTAPQQVLDVRGTATFGISTGGSIAIPVNLTNYNVNYGSSAGVQIGQGNQWARLYDYNINNFGNNFTLDMSCQNSTYNTVLFANNWNGNRVIGINKQWPDYTLDIAGHLNVNGVRNRTVSFAYGWLAPSGYGYFPGGTQTINYSIYASNRMAAEEFDAYSDQRIKTDIQDVDDDSALQVIRAIQPKRYNYIDTVSRNDQPVWGFIAQQVASVLDYSTAKVLEYIPNVFKEVTVTDNTGGSILSSSSLDTDVFDLTKIDDNKIQLKIFIHREEKECMLQVLVKEIINKTEIQLEETLGQDITKAFIYGQRVNDFHTLNKDAIFTVSVAALQEVDRQLQTAEETILMQDQMIDSLNQQIQDILTRVSSI